MSSYERRGSLHLLRSGRFGHIEETAKHALKQNELTGRDIG